MRVGVIGSGGFIGKHLYLSLSHSSNFLVTGIHKSSCTDVTSLRKKTEQTDVLIIAAGVNRADKEEYVYSENIKLIKTLIKTLTEQDFKGRLIFLSSTQNVRDNAYGRSKNDSETLLREFSKKHKVELTILVLPNIFGESQKPHYNCVVPTFIHQILKNEKSQIADAEVELLHVRHIVELIKDILNKSNDVPISTLRPKGEVVKVNDLHNLIIEFLSYKNEKIGTIPPLISVFHKDLFNTFRYICWELKMNLSGNFVSNGDNRGELFELVKTQTSGQVMFSTTKPGLVRGGHFHTRKIERFCLVSGHSIVTVDSVFGDFSVNIDCSSDSGTYVDMPNYAVHKMENTGQKDVVAVFWINEIYNPDDSDTYN